MIQRAGRFYLYVFDMVRRVQVNEIISEVSKTGTGDVFVPNAGIRKKVKVSYFIRLKILTANMSDLIGTNRKCLECDKEVKIIDVIPEGDHLIQILSCGHTPKT